MPVWQNNNLYDFYRITGDRKYLAPVPAALEWLENSYVKDDPAQNYTHARVYQLGTNKPLYSHREGTTKKNGRYYQDHTFGNFVCHYGQAARIDVPAHKKEFERVNALTPEQAFAEYERKTANKKALPDVKPEEVESIIKSLNSTGAWIEDLSISNYVNPCADNRKGTTIRGISTGTYIGNMKKMIGFVGKR